MKWIYQSNQSTYLETFFKSTFTGLNLHGLDPHWTSQRCLDLILLDKQRPHPTAWLRHGDFSIFLGPWFPFPEKCRRNLHSTAFGEQAKLVTKEKNPSTLDELELQVLQVPKITTTLFWENWLWMSTSLHRKGTSESGFHFAECV